jgi:iron complex outermembrane recepter protein
LIRSLSHENNSNKPLFGFKAFQKYQAFYLVVLLTLLAASQVLAEAVTHHFNIKSQKAGPALMDLAESSNIQIIIVQNLGNSKMLSAVQGVYTVHEALDIMLSKSGLAYEYSAENTVIIKYKQAPEKSKKIDQSRSSGLLEEMLVTEGYRRSIEQSVKIKRHSIAFTDSILATDIAEFPDQNLAEALQRMPGVSIYRTRGVGEKVSVRNVGPLFTHTTINNVTAATGSDSREVNFDIFASELVQRVTVKKSPNASDEEGGVAGSVQITTARPFDYDGYTAVGSVEAGYSDYARESDPRVSFLMSNTFAEDRFGILFSMLKEDRSYRFDTNRAVGTERTTLSSIASIVLPTDLSGSEQFTRWHVDRHSVGEQGKLSATLSVDWVAKDNLRFGFDVLTSRYSDDYDQYMSVTDLSGATSISDYRYDRETNIISAATFDNAYVDWISKRVNNETNFLQSGLTGQWQSQDWRINGLFGFSEVEYTSLERQANYRAQNMIARYEFSGHYLVRSGPTGTLDLFDPTRAYFQKAIAREKLKNDKKSVIQIDAVRQLGSSYFDALSFGLRRTTKRNTSKNYGGDFAEGFATVDGKDLTQRTVADDSYAPISGRQFLSAAGPPVGFQSGWLLVPADVMIARYFRLGFSAPDSKGSYHQIDENTLAFYAEMDGAFEIANLPVLVNFGGRYIKTDVTGYGYKLDLANNIETRQKDTGDYADFLPSINLSVELSDALVGRFSLARVMSRPPSSYLSSKFEVKETEQRIYVGNPDLKPTRSNQTDLGLEYYFAPESLLSMVLFYKDLRSFTANTDGVYVDYNGVPYELKQKINGEGTRLVGAEFLYQTPFTFLPSPFDGLGINFNYTYVDSTKGKTSGGRSYELNDLSTHTTNLTLYYEKNGFDARFAYNYRSESQSNSNGIYRAPYGQLDFSAGLQLSKAIKLTLKMINVTNEYAYGYYASDKYNNSLIDYGRRIGLGLRFRF